MTTVSRDTGRTVLSPDWLPPSAYTSTVALTTKQIAEKVAKNVIIHDKGKEKKRKGKVYHAPQESVGGCSSPSPRPWARSWRTVASVTPDLRLPSQPQGITAHWLVPNYTACWHRHMCVNNLPRVALDSGEAGIWVCDHWSQVHHPTVTPSSQTFIITLRTKLSSVVYCNYSCLWVCLFVCSCVWVCYHHNSKLRASIFTKLGL